MSHNFWIGFKQKQKHFLPAFSARLLPLNISDLGNERSDFFFVADC